MEIDDFEFQQVEGTTPNLVTELAQQLAAIAPEALSDGKIDLEKLRELLSVDLDSTAERYGFYWPGKKRALRAAQESTFATLNPKIHKGREWKSTKNIVIEGDNLEVLKILQKHYHTKVDLIYIDPPYNTGNDFIYPDNFKEGFSSYLEWTMQVGVDGKKLSTNSETEGRFHSNWLNMMYPRLKLARNLLSPSGVIFISIGDTELANLVLVMREIFGEKNELPIFTRVTKKSSNNGSTFSPSTDYIVGFARNIDETKPFSVDLTEEQIKTFNKSDARGSYKEIGLFQAALKHGGSRYPIQCPDGQMVNTPRGLPWRWNQAKFQKGLEDDLVVFKQTPKSPLIDEQTGEGARWNVYTKLYLHDREEAGLLPRNFSEEFQNSLGTRDLSELAIPFDFPKPVKLIQFLLGIINKPNALVLDLFGGSGTTAHAVMEQNLVDGGDRKFILVQLPEPTLDGTEARKSGFMTISDLTRKRIELVGDRIANSLLGAGVDTGFRFYVLSESNFRKWQATNEISATALEQHLLDLRESANESSSIDELLSEILIKQGYSLTENIGELEIENLLFRTVGENLIIAYLDEKQVPKIAQLKKVLDLKPAKFIILENVLNGDDELKTNLIQECKSRNIEIWTA